jgi:hypothetical protein
MTSHRIRSRACLAQPDETPGPTAWTTVRSITDERVKPQTGRHPASALEGASNIVIKRVCPGRTTSHLGAALDSVTFAALVDAIERRGPAKAERFPDDVCGLDWGFDGPEGEHPDPRGVFAMGI